MTDFLFSIAVPTVKELSFIRQVEYSTRAPDGPDFFSIQVFNNATRETTEPDIRVPNWYHQHVLRFLWRHRLFISMDHNSRIKLKRGLGAMVKRYIAFMDAIMDSLLMGCRIAKGTDITYRSRTFDMYLGVEFYIGYHDYSVGDTWRQANKNIMLEGIDVKELGEYYYQDPSRFLCYLEINKMIQTDWEAFYADQDKLDSLWSGSEYGFDIKKVPDDKWREIGDRLITFFDTTKPPAKSTL